MHPLHLVLVISLLGTAGAFSSGCTNGTSAIVTGSNVYPATGPLSGAASGERSARTTRVASTAAHALICGVAFDPAKLKASYLAYEAKEGSDGAQLSMIEKSYDETLSTMTEKSAAIASRCSARQAAWTQDRNAEFSQKYKEDIQAELRSYMAGTFTVEKKTPAVDEPFNAKAFWKDIDDG